MVPHRLHLAGVVALVILSTGCLADGSGGTTTPTPTLTTTSSTSTSTSTPTDATTPTPPTPAPPGGTAAYVLGTGSLPDGFASANATLAVVFVEQAADLGPCYSGIYRGPYKPTPTPIPPADGPCHRPATGTVTVDLADLDGNRTVAEVTVPSGTRGHALVLTNLTVTRADGSEVSAVKNAGGGELLAEPAPPSGRYVVTLSIDEVDDQRAYDYRVTWEYRAA